MSPVALATSLSGFDFSGYFLLGFIKDNVYRAKVQSVNEMRDRIVRAAECVTNEMLVSTC
jgi:hypothetical protein